MAAVALIFLRDWVGKRRSRVDDQGYIGGARMYFVHQLQPLWRRLYVQLCNAREIAITGGMGSNYHFAQQQSSRPNVRFGSKADIARDRLNVSFTPKADIAELEEHVRLVPKADIAISSAVPCE